MNKKRRKLIGRIPEWIRTLAAILLIWRTLTDRPIRVIITNPIPQQQVEIKRN